MSLNRSEQIVFDYWQGNPDERRFWEDKVRSTAADCASDHAAAQQLDRDLWAYYQERSSVLPHFREAAPPAAPLSADSPSAARTSMRNLAELLLRLWAPPRPKPKKSR
ncbi:hypothetical protein AXK11_02990 [Cephaloticoccus primus]|uniref:Uncharacterized protein n=1 Tax=Cephaloticoccus primus TaxID=1548207 RepID=A0A139SR91_9BACT|nr:hypothetical protein AXK11_02990 [Cephaloticoccus primus]